MIVTTSPPMWPRRIEFFHRAARWLLPAALIALTPKCVLCVLAYAGLGAAFGLGGPEICGTTAGSTEGDSIWLPLIAVMVAVVFGFSRLVKKAPCERGRCVG